MPKLTNEDYLKRHDLLGRLWEQNQRAYSYLSYQQQRDLHDYYVPTKSLTDLELLAHRKRVTKQNPSLPQRASRAFAALRQGKVTKPISVSESRGRQISARALARPEIDAKKLARALLQMAEEMTPEERAKFEAEGERLLGEKKKRAA
jgi:hypothetical protein